MRIDLTSMFFNSKIEGQTATAAWGTAVSKQNAPCLIYENDDFCNIFSGMLFCSKTDVENLEIKGMSSSRELIMFSIFNKIFVNGIEIKNRSFILLLVKEHSSSHEGRMILSYPMYAKYKLADGTIISNEQTKDDIATAIGCSKNGCWFVSEISIANQDTLVFNAHIVDKDNPKIYKGSSKSRSAEWQMLMLGSSNLPNDVIIEKISKTTCIKQKSVPLQQIVYGAPGTGKSFGVDEDVKHYNMKDIRTTFHPDSDYSTFVGAYKPQMEKVTVRDDRGFPVKENGQTVYEKKIVYKYTQQAFLKAYVAAWKDLENPHVLVIEEINRGNCAQIFGDLFQLLDRNDIGFSKYPITADTDIMQVLNEEFDGLQVANGEAINAHYKDDVVSDVVNGLRLLLPNNLYIWATMNTSDQSLFPIDSAFKRRWEWKYVPISNAGKAWKICVNGKEYDWWSFIEKINNKIWNVTKSEDKKLGYFFCKADRKITEGDEENNVISADRFVGKVLFYVYNDVYKDYGFDDDIFKDKEDNNSDLLFQTFFMANGKPNEAKIEVFLKNLEVKMASEVEDASVNEEVVPEGSQEVSSDINTLSNDIETEGKDTTKYSFDGKENLGKGQLAVSIIEKYMKEHPNLSYEELKDIFPDSMMGNSLKLIGLIVKEDDVKNAPYNYQKKAYGYFKPDRRYKDVNGVDFFVSNNWNITNIQNIIDFAKQQGWIIESK